MLLPRRALLAAVALPTALPTWSAPVPWAGTWVDDQGRHWLGRFGAQARRIELPGRAHGLAALTDGSVLVAARRPGDWLLRWEPGREPEPQWMDEEWRVNGHVRLHPAYPDLSFWTETRPADDSAWLAVRDARSLALRARWPLPGHDPHDLLPMPEGRLLIAIGGVPRAGRQRIAGEPMEAQLLLVDPRDGQRLKIWRLPDPALSPRHLARRGDCIAVALQSEHGDAAERAQAPLFARLEGNDWQLCEIRQPSGYTGDLAASREGWHLSCPRDHCLLRLDAQGRLIETVALKEACALLGDWALGLQAWGPGAPRLAPRHWDNHATWLSA